MAAPLMVQKLESFLEINTLADSSVNQAVCFCFPQCAHAHTHTQRFFFPKFLFTKFEYVQCTTSKLLRQTFRGTLFTRLFVHIFVYPQIVSESRDEMVLLIVWC
ncbi:unnamed protein product [Ixodes pacificus]